MAASVVVPRSAWNYANFFSFYAASEQTEGNMQNSPVAAAAVAYVHAHADDVAHGGPWNLLGMELMGHSWKPAADNVALITPTKSAFLMIEHSTTLI